LIVTLHGKWHDGLQAIWHSGGHPPELKDGGA
jgi:hypothetical protein